MVSAFILLLLKIVAVAAAGIFLVCVLTIMARSVSLIYRVGRLEEPSDFLHRVRRIAFRAWIIALIAGLSMVVFALATGQR
jgi:hypothetical protein